VHVGLEDRRALLERALEGDQRVLGRFAARSAMSEHDRSRQVEKGVCHVAYVIVRGMAVLTRDVLLAEIAAGSIVLDPYDPTAVGPASIDLTLGDEIRVISPGPNPIPIRDDADYRNYTRVERLDRPYVLCSGETIHGITRERVTLSPSLCGLLEGRSRFARLGLMIHVTSAFVQPGVSNRQVLEMGNVSGHPLEIHAGVKICQLVVLRAEGSAVYSGRFARQEEL
jgi:dCTP deaminase